MKNTLCALLLILAPAPFTSSQMRSSSDDTGPLARDQYVNISRNLTNTQRQNQAWQSVVYAYWDRVTGTSSLRVHDFMLQRSGESRQFVFGSLRRYNVSTQKWERVNLRIDHPIVLKAEKRQVYSTESDQKIVNLTPKIGLFWAEWKEDGHSANTLIFAGMLCEDVDIGNPPVGMIATCVPFANHARAMFVPDPKIRSK